MTEDRLLIEELSAKSGDADFLRLIAENVLQLIMEADIDGVIGAGRHERSGERATWRNGHRERTLDTRLGTLNLKIPKLRAGSYFPGFLEPRKMVEKALVAVIQEAWIGGVSTRRVDELVQAMGMTGISKSSVSKLCKDIDERVHAFLGRPLTGEWPYLWLDATYLKVRQGVYKVDRLTRSLLDFTKLVEAFDKAGVSFVSITQSFNTTTSMGRLTLNMLLSFAQFEREVTAERIRDKIAASKARGMWMGGTPPLGYRPDPSARDAA